MLIDTHCHVHFQAFKNDQDEVIKRTRERGVFMITVGTQQATSQAAIETARAHEGVWAAVGLHPNHLCEQEFWDEEELPQQRIKTRCEDFDPDYYAALARDPKCVAIGECGLDYFHLPKHLDREALIAKQKATTQAHLTLATDENLPVIIHSREAFADQYVLLKAAVEAGQLPRRGVIHCFTGSLEEAMAYIDLGFMVSVTGIVTFKPKKEQGEFSPMQSVAAKVPLEYLMLETDAPYLAPDPYRGERCEPWMVEAVAAKVAALRGISVEEVIKTTGENAKRLFGLPANI